MRWFIACLLAALLLWPNLARYDGFPAAAMQANWGHPGSCSYAATAAMLRYYGYDAEAQDIRDHYTGAPWVPITIEHLLSERHIPWEATSSAKILAKWGEEGRIFVTGLTIERNSKTIPYAKGGQHAVVVFHFDVHRVGIYDSNHAMPDRVRYVPTQNFLREWQHWAVSIKPTDWGLGIGGW